VLVIDGVGPACRLLRLARDQIARSCLIIFVQQQPRCVLLDLDIYGVEALEVCRTLRAMPETAETMILFMTAKQSVEAFDVALLAGADEILLKPLPDADLLARVEDALQPERHTAAQLRRRCERLCQQRAELERAEAHRRAHRSTVLGPALA
jgi:PleD family two-component response regulator